MRQPVDSIEAYWTIDGKIVPLRFTCMGRRVRVADVGRSWKDDEGRHILCMLQDQRVCELVLDAEGLWWFIPPAGPANA